jgi:NAD(P)H-hydrate epimerase
MMENAGRNLAELTLTLLGESRNGSRVLVLAGTGGNGGGGLCAGRHLANHGLAVDYTLGDRDGLSEVTGRQLSLLELAGGREVDPVSPETGEADIVLDALIGYSLLGAPSGRSAELIRWLNAGNSRIISLDVPSGVDADSGLTPGEYVRPQTTLTLAWPKTGLLPRLTGELWLGDLGIPPAVYTRAGLKNFRSPFIAGYLVRLTASEQ